ncbi:MAG: DUF4270 domain-containing protein [Bacteroidales bacterium]|nr:DUF4270 domain-containing protein [Bacteroidales bacterium]
MKLRKFSLIFVFIAFIFISCDDAADNLGKQVQPGSDEIIVQTDTFHLSTETVQIESIISRPDSFLLGEFDDNILGTTKADILAELRLFQNGYTYLDPAIATTKADSVVMSLYCSSAFGTISPLHISVYELKDSLQRDTQYMTDMDPKAFVNFQRLIGDVKYGTTGLSNKEIRFHLNGEFLSRFFTLNPQHYLNQDEFRKFIPGIYITTDFGGSTMLNLRTIKISLYYHYAFNDNPEHKIQGRHDFFVNSEVKKVNRVTHPLRTLNLSPKDEYNYIASPANYYTRVRIPLDRIRRDINVGDKILDVNSASIRLNVKNIEKSDSTMIPYVNNLLLIKESAVERFFKNSEAISDTCSFLASRDSVYVSKNNYNYEFNFSGLANLIEQEVKKKENTSPYLDMLLVPVTPLFRQSTNSLDEVVQNNQLQTLRINSGKHPDIPMKMEVIYSGF